MRGDRYRSRGDGKNCQPALPIWRICRLSRLPAGIFVARLTAGRVLLATLPAKAFFMQIPSQGGVRCRQAFRRQSLRCGGAQVASFGRHFRASVPVVSGGIFHLASWRIFSSCAVWPALVCTLEILLGLLTSARRYVLIKVGVAEAPLFTPTHSCLRPLRLLRFILLRKTLSKWQKTVALFLLICYNTQVTSGGPLALLRMNA